MARSTWNTVSVERWEIDGWKAGRKANRVEVSKIVTRNRLGQFHGATNFRGTVDKVHKTK